MLATRVKGLHVCYGEIELRNNSRAPVKLDDGGWGWRVRVDVIDSVLPMKFLREIDAAIAMHAIADLLDWTMDKEPLVAAIVPLSVKIRRLMTESLQW